MTATGSASDTVPTIHAGTATNIIPDTATIEGTARTLTEPARQRVGRAIERRCRGIASANGCDLRFHWEHGSPPTINDPAMADYVAAVARETVGPDRYFPVPRPSMGG